MTTRFSDTDGRDWDLEITVRTAERVKQSLGLDLLDLLKADSNVFQRLATDTVLLVDVLYLLLEKQLAKRNVSEEEFAESLTGDVLEDACTALTEALVFFSRPSQRELLREALAKVQGLTQTAQRKVLDKLPELVKKAEAKIDQQIDTLIETTGN